MCELDIDIWEPGPDVWEESEQWATAPLRCDACGGAIAVGDPYVAHHSDYSEERREAYRIASPTTDELLCMPCHGARARFCKAHGVYSLQPSSFVEYLDECIINDDGDVGVVRWKSVRAQMNRRWRAAQEAR